MHEHIGWYTKGQKKLNEIDSTRVLHLFGFDIQIIQIFSVNKVLLFINKLQITGRVRSVNNFIEN